MKNCLKVLLLVMIGALLTSCAAHQKGPEMFNPQVPDMAGFEQKVDNFLVILDASGSKQGMVNGQQKLDYAKSIVSHMNQTIPNGLSLNSALRRYGKGIKESQPVEMKTEIVYPSGQYSRPRFDDALNTISKASGLTFMEAAIDAGSEDLKKFGGGRSAVIIVSDGKVHTNDPIQAAKRMKSQYGDNVCIYTIWIPSGTADINQVAKDKKLMQQIAEAGACGFSTDAGSIASAAGMADFVRKAFLTAKKAGPVVEVKCADSDNDGVCDEYDDCPNTPMGTPVDSRGCPVACPDSDNDGVCDKDDDCPNTPYGTVVDSRGCPVPCTDSDNDGVCDEDDDCPNTPIGVSVDSRGCPIEAECEPVETKDHCAEYGGDTDGDYVCDNYDDCPNTPMGAGVNSRGCWVIENLLFDYDKSVIRPKYYPDLDEVARILRDNPYLSIEIQGHTCNIGSQKYNLPLSERRANSVRQYLINKGIAPERLPWRGYGKERPAASNDTEEGREQNRRVELFPIR